MCVYICLQISPRCWVLQSFTYFSRQVDCNNRHSRCHRYGRHHLWSINYNRIFNVNKLQMPKHPITPSASQLKYRTTNCANIRSGHTPDPAPHFPYPAHLTPCEHLGGSHLRSSWGDTFAWTWLVAKKWEC